MPTPDDHAREDAFLDQHLAAGVLIHQTVAEALVSALDSETDTGRRELLALRVFAEYVGALESFGAWGWSIRNRETAPLLLDAFLSYGVADVRAFYDEVASHDGELTVLLNLPPTQDVTDAFREGGFPHSPLLADLGKLERNLKEAAKQYLHPQEWFVASYNKAKHGAPIIHKPGLSLGEFLLIAPNRELGGDGRYAFYKFGSAAETVRHTLKLIQSVSHATQGLVSFARNLKVAGLLNSYER